MKRITPASAGKSTPVELYHDKVKDHPRECGEKPILILRITWLQGSPPRVRGKVHVCYCSLVRSGITPASAGKSQLEKMVTIFLQGSPPRVRGKAPAQQQPERGRRITPASAGKSECRTPEWPDCRDHPRECGEKWVDKIMSVIVLGSPPRVRGKERPDRRKPNGTGITPASAGKSPSTGGTAALSEDHPRECGEKAAKRLLTILT